MRLLVIRTSAMGDAALTVPVLKEMRKKYPGTEMVLVTRKAFKPFFTSVDGLDLFFPDFAGRHKGFTGIIRLFSDLRKKYLFDHVVDLHDVMRSQVLRTLFRLTGVPVSVISKGRDEKRSLVTGRKKVQLRHSVLRYCDAFSAAGFSLEPSGEKWIIPAVEALQKVQGLLAGDSVNIGVAPFARHKLKMWPLENMLGLLRMIAEDRKTKFFFFGGKEDSAGMETFQKTFPGSVNVIGSLSLEEEIALISRLDLMISMDSSNMHMAALTGTKVISIWGGTDPLAGFGAWMQPESYSIRIPVDDLICRPCTVYGKGECGRGDFACMNWLTPEMVFKRMKKLNVI